MKLFRTIVVLAVAVLPSSAQINSTIRILLGVGDTASNRWDGTVQASGASITGVVPWRFEGSDGISSNNVWHCSTHLVRLFNGTTPASLPGNGIVANGILLDLSSSSPDAEIAVTTAQGDFKFRLSEVSYGASLPELGGRVMLDRIPPSSQVTKTKEEEDFPSAAAGKNGEMWTAYIQFHHNPRHNELREPLSAPPKDFSKWKLPTGGDQLFVRRYANGKWDEPIAVTAGGLDLYRDAIAVDGSGTPWVIWSQNINFGSRIPNFEIYGSSIVNGKPSAKARISNDAGNDVSPVVVTDAKGKIWVAWQGWRGGKAAIFAASQEDKGFGAAQKVSQSQANEWNPAIAADRNGRVTVAWDSYRNGNYDIYMRSENGGQWAAESPVAATARYEAYPSLAYDPSGRLWVAYEEGGNYWGKDFGAYDTSGIALYQGRSIRLRGFEQDNRVVETSASLDDTLPGFPSIHFNKAGVQRDFEKLDADPTNAKTRKADQTARNGQNAKNNYPRLTIDDSGRIWLAFRSAHPVFWTTLGTVWTEHLVSFDGQKWTNPIFINHSDNLLDNRPALVATGGKLFILGSSDNRRRFDVAELQNNTSAVMKPLKSDPYNNDLYLTEISLGSGSPSYALTPGGTVQVAGTSKSGAREDQKVSALRNYKIGDLQIVRGEFHRHSEISMDGGNDGSIIEQFRYAIDPGELDWVGCCDHDNGAGREYTWWLTQKLTDYFIRRASSRRCSRMSAAFNIRKAIAT